MNCSYNNIYKNCCTCLSESLILNKLSASDAYNTKLIIKLKSFVGDLDWIEDYVMCQVCTIQLEAVNSFRQLCLRSYETRQKINANTIEEINKSDIKEELGLTTVVLSRKHGKFQQAINSEQRDGILENSAVSHRRDNVQLPNENIVNCETTLPLIENCAPSNIYHLTEGKTKTKDPLQENQKPGDEGFDTLENDSGDNESDSDFLPETTKTRKVQNRRPPRKKRYTEFVCEVCSEKFTALTKITQHCISEHHMDKKDVKPYACEVCPRKFASWSNLDEHIAYHMNYRPNMCTFCGKGFVTTGDLHVHEKQHLNKREYQCPHCPKTFNTHKDVRSHKLVVHTDPSKWAHECQICSKRFPTKSNFDSHMRRHNNIRPFACHLCEKKFTDNGILKKHVMRIHMNIRPFKCSLCDLTFKDKHVMGVHLAKIHKVGDIKLPENVRKYFCHLCPKSYTAKNKLTRHIYSHSGEKPFACDVCSKQFTDKFYAKQHMRIAHGVEEIKNLTVEGSVY